MESMVDIFIFKKFLVCLMFQIAILRVMKIEFVCLTYDSIMKQLNNVRLKYIILNLNKAKTTAKHSPLPHPSLKNNKYNHNIKIRRTSSSKQFKD